MDLPEHTLKDLPEHTLQDLPEDILPGVEPGQALGYGRLTQNALTTCGHTLRKNAERLQQIPVKDIISGLSRWTARWLDSNYAYRREAVARLVSSTGFSTPVAGWGLDSLFSVWTASSMHQLLVDELGSVEVLERFVDNNASGVRRKALGPRLVTHILAGNVPPPTVQSLLAALLTRASSLLKSPSAESWFPYLVVRSLEVEFPEVKGCIAVVRWRGGDAELETAAFKMSDVVVAFGSDASIHEIGKRIRPPTRLVARGHRVSVGYITREALMSSRVRQLASEFALDVAIFDQLGCLSPHAILVESGGDVSPQDFAELMAETALPEVMLLYPPGRADLYRAAERAQFVGVHAFTDRLMEGPGGAVIVTRAEHFEPSCLGRVVFVRPVSGVADVANYLRPVAGLLQGVALAALEPRLHVLASQFASLGACRICSPGNLQRPPAGFVGDGHPVVGSLVRWVSWDDR